MSSVVTSMPTERTVLSTLVNLIASRLGLEHGERLLL
jgi:hypothetical protein